MKILLQNLSQKQELERIKILLNLQLALFLVAHALELYHGMIGPFGFLTKTAVLAGIYFLFGKTLKQLNYTLWTFSFFLMTWTSFRFLENLFYGRVLVIFICYFFILVFLSYTLYVLFSPLYFPRVAWWEYDFRYRGDLKIVIKSQGTIFQGRLTDLRRGAGHVLCFQDFPINSCLDLDVSDKPHEYALRAQIVSKREPYAGRGFSYGVRFTFDGLVEKKAFQKFAKEWNSHKKVRFRHKFEKSV